MRPVLPWIAAYLAILLVWALMILRRTGPTLWKGRSLVAVNLAFVLVSTATVLLQGQALGEFIVFDLVLLVVAVLVRKKWLLLRISHTGSAAVLEKCLKQTRAPWTRRPGGYSVRCGEADMAVTIQPTLLGPLSVRFLGGSESKKAALLSSLFGKQFHSSFPTPRIRA